MSRTNKDIKQAKSKLNYYHRNKKSWRDVDYITIEYMAERRKYDLDLREFVGTGEYYTSKVFLDKPGHKPKLPREYTDWNHKWYKKAPGWFVTEFMQAPVRAKCRNWEKVATGMPIEMLETLDCCPDYGKKPHVYYY